MKTCIKCSETKDEEDFSWKVQGQKRNNTCRECHRAYRRQHYLDNKSKYIAKARNWENKQGGKIFVKYGVTPEKHLEMFNKYDGKCWVCKSNTATHIDHDHSCCDKKGSCGKCVRGLLCVSCNTGLGMFKDNLDILQKAMVYLEEHTS